MVLSHLNIWCILIVIIDNYGSFAFNIFHYFLKLGEAREVVRNGAVSVTDLVDLKPRVVVTVPARHGGRIPPPLSTNFQVASHFLGIRLGYRCMGALSATAWRARPPMHGRPSCVTHDCQGLFKELPPPFRVECYHCLVVELDEPSAPHLSVTARSEEHGP
ncbi:glutamine amidotransferase-related protein [Bradyrhizobium sp. ORS 111]|uniref:glutamine amidotransferase-related protein n=1 Tax=Bradyrhizobium sp. ORS 111 TaxID=1685958 RepID=UPI00388EAEE5